jgi:Septum formation
VIVRTAPFLLALGVVALAACGNDDSSDPREPHDVPVLEIEASPRHPVCLQVTEDLPDEVETLPVIDCAVPHTHEIYTTVVYTENDVYPGEEALGSFAQVECLSAFEPFVGVSAFDSSLSYTWIVPSLDGWNNEDDRKVLCILTDRDGAELVGSQRGSNA